MKKWKKITFVIMCLFLCGCAIETPKTSVEKKEKPEKNTIMKILTV